MNSSEATSSQAVRFEPTENQSQSSARVAEAAPFDAEQLAAIRQQLDENQGNWPEDIAASVEEDYRQLLKDFGLR